MYTLKDICNIAIRKITTTVFRVFYIFPIHKNRILFESFGGRSYSCNPKYICEYLLAHGNGKYDLVWSFIDPQGKVLPSGITSIKKNSLKYMYYRFSAKIVISNMTDPIYLPKRKSQKVICTWHAGGAYKRVGDSFTKNASKRKEWQIQQLRKRTDVWLSSSDLFTRYNIKDAYGFAGEILKTGMPRNDIFFSDELVKKAGKKVREIYDLSDSFIVLFAPTFRDNIYSNGFELPRDALIEELQKTQKKNIAFLYRGHYYVDNNSEAFEKKGDVAIINVSDYHDMQELLAASDMLITDYSSSMWDFALTNKPCLLWVPDRKEYDDERGTYTSIDTWPAIACENAKQLLETIDDLDKIDFKTIYIRHFFDFNSYESGNAARKVCEYISKECFKK